MSRHRPAVASVDCVVREQKVQEVQAGRGRARVAAGHDRLVHDSLRQAPARVG